VMILVDGANRAARGRTSGAGHRPRHLADLDTRSGRTVNVMELSPIAAALVCLEWASAHLLGLWACRGSVVVSAERRPAGPGSSPPVAAVAVTSA
jgi:hypothetical protein